MATRNYYEILGLAYDANEQEILSAYEKLKNEFDVDLFPDDSKQARRFQHVREAKKKLLDPEEREKHNSQLIQQGLVEKLKSNATENQCNNNLTYKEEPNPIRTQNTFPPNNASKFTAVSHSNEFHVEDDIKISAQPKRKNIQSGWSILIQTTMLSTGAISGVTAALLILWFGFNTDPFGLFNADNSTASTPTLVKSKPDLKAPDGSATSSAKLRDLRTQTEKSKNADKTNPKQKAPVTSTDFLNKDQTIFGDERKSIAEKNTDLSIIAKLKKAGERCTSFDWWPNTPGEHKQLQDFIDLLLPLHKASAAGIDAGATSAIVLQVDQWRNRFREGFRAPNKPTSTINDLNRWAVQDLKRSNSKFAVFGRLTNTNTNFGNNTTEKLCFEVDSTDVTISANRSNQLNKLNPGVPYLLIGVTTGPFNESDSTISAEIFFFRATTSNEFLQEPRTTNGKNVIDLEQKNLADATLKSDFGKRRDAINSIPWDFNNVANYEKKTNRLKAIHLEVYQRAKQEDNLSQRYAMLDYAREIAIETGDSTATYKYIDEITQSYPVDNLTLRIEAVKAFDKMLKTNLAEDLRGNMRIRLASDVIKFANEAYLARKFTQSSYLFNLAGGLIPSTDGRYKSLHRMNLHARAIAKKHPRMLKIAETLLNETDPSKQHTLGCYWCFDVGDWPTGLQHLALATNQKFEQIARLDRGGGETLEQRKKIADAWFELFSEIKGVEKKAIAVRALHHHKAILDDYAGIDKTIMENRIKELEEQKLTEPGEEYLKH